MAALNKQLERQSKPYNWNELIRLFEELSELPHAERQAQILNKNVDALTRCKLESMLDTLDKTISLVDIPLTSRIELNDKWYADQWIGQEIKGYLLETLLHEGSIAGVFIASQKEPVHRQVVIKLVRPDAPKEYLEFFRFEQRALAKLSHPNIATIHTVETTEESLSFIVMEYIEGTTLSHFCDESKLTIEQRLQLFLRICDAITYSHQRGVLHRDLKSSNILIREFENQHIPTIIDFGISSGLNDQIKWNNEHLMGTPEYMSPEHVLNIKDTDARADVYSLGMVLFSLLVGRIPFDRKTINKLDNAKRISLIAEFEAPVPSIHFENLAEDAQNEIAEQRSKSASQLAKQLNKELDFIYLKSTHKNRENRYQSVSEMGADVRRYLKNEAVYAHPASFLYRSKKLVQRNYVVSMSALLIAVLASLFVAKLIDQNGEIKAEAQRAQKEKQNAEQVASMIMETIGFANPSGMASKGMASVAGMLDHGYQNLKHTKGISANLRAKLLLSLSDAFLSIDEYSKADEINSIILEGLEVTNKTIIVEAHLMASKSAANRAFYDLDIGHAKKAFEFCVLNDIKGAARIKSQMAIGRAYSSRGQYTDANKQLQAALELYKKETQVDETLLAELYFLLGQAAFREDRLDESASYYSHAKTIVERHYTDEHPRALELEFGEIQLANFVKKGNDRVQRAERLHENFIKIWGENSTQVLLILPELAIGYASVDEYGKAIETTKKYLSVRKLFDEIPGAATARGLSTLAYTYIKNNQYREAMESASEAYELVTSDESNAQFTRSDIAGVTLMLAGSYAMLKEWETALPYYSAAIETFSAAETKSAHYLSWALSDRAMVYANLGKFELSLADAALSESIGQTVYPENDKRLSQRMATKLYTELVLEWDPEKFTLLKESWSGYVTKLGDSDFKMYSIIQQYILSKNNK